MRTTYILTHELKLKGMSAECNLPTPKEIHALQDLNCPFKISVAVMAEKVLGLLDEMVGGIVHGGLCSWTAAGRAGTVT
jgi:hypothetical protein